MKSSAKGVISPVEIAVRLAVWASEIESGGQRDAAERVALLNSAAVELIALQADAERQAEFNRTPITMAKVLRSYDSVRCGDF